MVAAGSEGLSVVAWCPVVPAVPREGGGWWLGCVAVAGKGRSVVCGGGWWCVVSVWHPHKYTPMFQIAYIPIFLVVCIQIC